MPFPKLRLKKSKQQYNVASKSVYVITVELLDNTQLECTLTAESTGRDCMDNVCQRLCLQQADLFGLRYASRRAYPKIRWVDLDRPLKKQLDKYAVESSGVLSLGVMFYVHDVSLLEDETTRYYYFLQLKQDVVDGRLRCNYEQAIVLASYSLQAEFGDHDPEKHTLEYLQDFALLPKPMLTQLSEERLSALTDAIIAQHASLRGIAQQLAEVYYIVGAQQLDGYGQECFLAKDERDTEVLIGASLTGIVVRKGQGQSPQFFKWNDITNLVNHKRYFGIECQNYEYSVRFVLDEADSAKYVWKMCVLQHTFYKLHASATETMSELNITLEHQPLQQQQLHLPSNNRYVIPTEDESGANLHPVSGHYTQQQQQPKLRPATSNLSIHKSQQQQQVAVVQDDMVLVNSGRSPMFSQALSSARSVNDLDQLPQHMTQVDNNGVPAYRAAPDYETAIRNKFGLQPQQPQVWQQQYSTAASPPQPKLITDILPQQQQLNYAYQDNGPRLSADGSSYMYNQPQQQTAVQQPNVSSLYSTSTPELNRINMTYHQQQPVQQVMPTQDQIVAELQRLNLYKPPPPYPGRPNQSQQQQRIMSSTSTPDLASSVMANHSGMMVQPVSSSTNNNNAPLGGSSPDLVSRRNLGMGGSTNAISGGDNVLHRTLDNLHHYVEQVYSAEDLTNGGDNNNVTTTNATATPTTALQSHLVHDVIPNNFVAFSQQVMAAASTQTQKFVTPSGVPAPPPPPPPASVQGGPSQLSCSEPIYQNQAELRAQQLDPVSGEPIYQNLPAHDALLVQEEADHPHEDTSLSTNNTTTTTTTTTTTNKIRGHVSRIAITNSREDLQVPESSDVVQPPVPAQKTDGRKRSVTKISIGTTGSDVVQSSPCVDKPDSSCIETEESSSVKQPQQQLIEESASLNRAAANNESNSSSSKGSYHKKERPRTTSGKTAPVAQQLYSVADEMMDTGSNNTGAADMSALQSSDTTVQSTPTGSVPPPRTPSSKPRAGRKRWAFNFGGSKTGSLKSLKSVKSTGDADDTDSHRDTSSSIKLGPMMLATLHGLTRSRPDLLAESLATFSTFSSPSRMPKDEIGAHLEAKLAEGEVLREFERIPKKKLPSGGYEQLFRTATLGENSLLNRFKDVLPYDENRVKLAAGDKDNRNGYINASHVSATVGAQQRFYIAAQGPLPNTVAHFWQMVLQCDVHLLVMLTETSTESSATSSIPYWPTKTGATAEVGNGFRITNLSSASYDQAYTTTTLRLVHTPTKRTRTLWHLQYTDWGEAGCPSDVRAFLNFLEELSALRNHIATNATEVMGVGRNKNPPVLVHCSAGVGRTGVAILTDILLYCVDHNVDIDIPKMLTHLRQQRMLMVQTVAQYKFVHTVLIHYLKQSRLI